MATMEGINLNIIQMYRRTYKCMVIFKHVPYFWYNGKLSKYAMNNNFDVVFSNVL